MKSLKKTINCINPAGYIVATKDSRDLLYHYQPYKHMDNGERISRKKSPKRGSFPP